MYKMSSLHKNPTAMLFMKGKVASKDFPAGNKKSKLFLSWRTIQIIKFLVPSRISEPYKQTDNEQFNGPWYGVLQILSMSTKMCSVQSPVNNVT